MRGFTRPLVTLIATAALASGAVITTAPAALAGPAAADAPRPPDRQRCQQALESLRGLLPELAGAVKDRALVGIVRQDLDEAIAGLAANKIPDSKKLVQDLTKVAAQLPVEHHPRLFDAVHPAVNRCLPGTIPVSN